MKYRVHKYDYTKSLLDNVLTNRGISDIEAFLDLDYDVESEGNPLHFSNMQLACGVLYNHINKNSKIVVVVDQDCDGISSSSTLVRYLKYRFPNIDLEVIIQEGNKAHGFNNYIMSRIYEIKPQLVIMPDAGSSDCLYWDKLIKANIHLIILDHHEYVESEATERLNKGIIVVNNHGSNKVNKFICASGIVYLFIKLFNETIYKDNYEDTLLDIVSIALIGDSCSMKDIYTRYLTIQGLESITNPFILALLNKQKEKVKKINIMSIAFYIVPLINACIRVCSIKDRYTVFNAIAFDKDIDKAVDICIEAKKKQDEIRDNEFNSIVEEVENNKLYDDGAILIIKNDITPAITGLTANKIASKYNKPCIILRDIGGKYGGSMRCPIETLDFKKWINDSNIAQSFGHAQAAGFYINSERVDDFKSILPELNEIIGDNAIFVDKVYEYNKINTHELFDVIENEDLWGTGVREPLFVVNNIRLYSDDVSILGKKENTIKFSCCGIDYLMFNVDDKIKNQFFQYNSFKINVLGRFAKNEFRGKVTIQLIIEDFEIEKNNDFFF